MLRRLGVIAVGLFCLAAGDWSYGTNSGMSVDQAFARTTGRRDVKLAVLGSGVQWDNAELVEKAALNPGELQGDALPQLADGKACNGVGLLAGYDCNADGAFTVADYKADPRIQPMVPDECHPGFDPARTMSTRLAGDVNRNCILDPGDLILLFSDHVDDDANGYTDDICGWDFFANDNDPYDDARTGIGTTHASNIVRGVCPGCSYVPLRVADDYIGEANDLAKAVVYAADNKVRAVSAGVFTVDMTSFARAAFDYAYSKNVLIVTGIGDANARSHTMPASANHVFTVGGVRYDGGDPAKATTFVLADGCSNSGAELSLVASTLGCSRAAAATVTGLAGLLFSAAADANITLEGEEAMQLLRASTDPIDPTGFNPRFGYGRANAAKLVDAVVTQRIPPEVDIVSPEWFAPIYANRTTSPIQIQGRVAAARAKNYDVAVQWAPGIQPTEADYRDIVAKRSGIPATTVTGGTAAIAQLDPAQIDTAQVSDHAITIRVRAVAHYESGSDLVGEARRVVAVTNQKNGLDPDLMPGFPLALGASIEASPKLADIDGDGIRDIVVGDSAGKLHVLAQKDGKPSEVSGFPYNTRPTDGLNTDLTSEVSVPSYASAPAYAVGAQTGIDATLARESIVQAPAIGDIDGDGKPEIIFATWSGTIYVVNSKGQAAPGWPARLPLVPSCPLAPQTGTPTRCADALHRWARGTSSAPVLVDLDGDGRLEISLSAFDGQLYVFDAGGAVRPGFPVAIANQRIIATPGAVDLSGDGLPELVVGAGPMTAIDGRGATLPGWPIAVPSVPLTPVLGQTVTASAAFADLDGDGRAEAVLSGNAKVPLVVASANAPPLEDTLAFGAFFGSPALGDVDQDGVPDVVVAGGPPSLAAIFEGSSPFPRPESKHAVEIWSGKTGKVFGSIEVEGFASLGDHAIADVNGDEYPEIITGTAGHLLHAADACGREAPGFPKLTNGWLAGTAAVGDIDGDLAKHLEVVAATRDGYLFAWTTKGTANGKVLWESFHHDNANTGALSTPLQQGTHERAATPLVCDAPATMKPERFEVEGGCQTTQGRKTGPGIVLVLALLAFLRRRR